MILVSGFCVKHQVSKSVTTLPGRDTNPGGSVTMKLEFQIHVHVPGYHLELFYG